MNVHALRLSVLGMGLLVANLTWLPGCREQRSEPKISTIKGAAESIDEATGKVAMRFIQKKNKMEITVEGTVTPQTEILINGRIAKLGEIKIGEQVTVTGYEDKEKARKRFIATRIVVERSEWTRATSQPASSPASTSKPAGK